jgi:PHD/YefM family antitoxin component YafN of YafNO toxin-antitoxin module
MKAITYSNARKNLRELIQNVFKNGEPTIYVMQMERTYANSDLKNISCIW